MSDEFEAVEEGPEAITLSDDSLIVTEDGGEPVSWKDYRSRAEYISQDDFTKLRQRDKETLSQQVAEQVQRQIAQRDQQWQDYVRQVQQSTGNGQRQQDDPLAEIWGRAANNGGFLTVEEGKELAKLFQKQLSSAGSQPNQQMLDALVLLNNRIDQLQQPVTELYSNRQQGQVNQLVDEFLRANLPEDAIDDEARELFLDFLVANEETAEERELGKSMMDVYPDFAGQRLNQMLKLADKINKHKIAEARRAKLPGVGGKASPSRPVKAPQSIEEIVAATWSDETD